MEGSEYFGGCTRVATIQPAQDWIDRWHERHPDAANQASLSSFKDFMVRQGNANLSQEELEKLYVQFLEWNRRVKH